MVRFCCSVFKELYLLPKNPSLCFVFSGTPKGLFKKILPPVFLPANINYSNRLFSNCQALFSIFFIFQIRFFMWFSSHGQNSLSVFFPLPSFRRSQLVIILAFTLFVNGFLKFFQKKFPCGGYYARWKPVLSLLYYINTNSIFAAGWEKLNRPAVS